MDIFSALLLLLLIFSVLGTWRLPREGLASEFLIYLPAALGALFYVWDQSVYINPASPAKGCRSEMVRQFLAMRLYSEDLGEFPRDSNWLQAISPYSQDPLRASCSRSKTAGASIFGMNPDARFHVNSEQNVILIGHALSPALHGLIRDNRDLSRGPHDYSQAILASGGVLTNKHGPTKRAFWDTNERRPVKLPPRLVEPISVRILQWPTFYVPLLAVTFVLSFFEVIRKSPSKAERLRAKRIHLIGFTVTAISLLVILLWLQPRVVIG